MARGLAQHGGPPGWLEESDPAGCHLYVMDGPSMPPSLTDHTTCTVISYITEYIFLLEMKQG
jgi:hypothetical protein